MNDDLKYVTEMVNLVATGFIILILSVLGMIVIAVNDDVVLVKVFSVFVVVCFFSVVLNVIMIARKIDFKKGDKDE